MIKKSSTVTVVFFVIAIAFLNSIAYAQPNSNGATSTVYISIEYTSITVHVNMPGQWMFGDLKVTTDASHTPVDIQFSASGNLTSNTDSIPTYYQIYDGLNTSYVPSQSLNTSVWQTPSELNTFSITRDIGNHFFKIWFAMDVSRSIPKGNYSCWIQMSIASHP